MTSHGSTQLWFPIADLLPIADHCASALRYAPDPQHGSTATAAAPPRTGLAAAFTANEVETLIITTADVTAGGGLEGLSRRLELAHRAYALLLADPDDLAEDGGRS